MVVAHKPSVNLQLPNGTVFALDDTSEFDDILAHAVRLFEQQSSREATQE
jgi:hypothetical protein